MASSFASVEIEEINKIHRIYMINPENLVILSNFTSRQKYFATVVARGFCVSSDTTIINRHETITIGTTGMKPKTAVPPGVRDKTSTPPGAQRIVAGPGAGAGTI